MGERHNRIYEIVEHNKPRTITEIGTFNGINAAKMCLVALRHNEDVHYTGIDLFESKTDEVQEREFDVKESVKLSDVEMGLNRIKERFPKFTFELIETDTRTLVPDGECSWQHADLAFIDGGHSVETIRHDYELVKNCKVVIFDDYYIPDEQGKVPDTTKYGCNQIVDGMDAVLISTTDPCALGGKIQVAMTPPNAGPYPTKLNVKTRNPIDDVQIQANIRYSTTLINNWAPLCEPHDKTCVIVSAGPSYLDHIDEIKELYEKPDHILLCVKSNHHDLIEMGIVPFGCVLLDPRPKIRRAFQEPRQGPHPDVNYFMASSCHPAVIDMFKDYKVWLYNALLNAGEVDVIRNATAWVNKDDPHATRFVGGGTTASGRAMLIAKLLGYRKLILYGFDSSYREPQDKNATTKHGQIKYWEIEKYGKKFWTSLEMLAQLQDFEKLFQHIANDPIFSVKMVGDGAIPHVWKHMAGQLAYWEDVFGEEKGRQLYSRKNPAKHTLCVPNETDLT